MTKFDREYYRRFYLDPRTAVVSRAEMKARAHLIAAYANHIGLPVRRIPQRASLTMAMRRLELQVGPVRPGREDKQHVACGSAKRVAPWTDLGNRYRNLPWKAFDPWPALSD